MAQTQSSASQLPAVKASATRTVEAPARAIGPGLTVAAFLIGGIPGLLLVKAINGRVRDTLTEAGVPVAAGKPSILDHFRGTPPPGDERSARETVDALPEPVRKVVTGDGQGLE